MSPTCPLPHADAFVDRILSQDPLTQAEGILAYFAWRREEARASRLPDPAFGPMTDVHFLMAGVCRLLVGVGFHAKLFTRSVYYGQDGASALHFPPSIVMGLRLDDLPAPGPSRVVLGATGARGWKKILQADLEAVRIERKNPALSVENRVICDINPVKKTDYFGDPFIATLATTSLDKWHQAMGKLDAFRQAHFLECDTPPSHAHPKPRL